MNIIEEVLGDGKEMKEQLDQIQTAVGMEEYSSLAFFAGILFACILTYGSFHTNMIENLAGSVVDNSTNALGAIGEVIPA